MPPHRHCHLVLVVARPVDQMQLPHWMLVAVGLDVVAELVVVGVAVAASPYWYLEQPVSKLATVLFAVVVVVVAVMALVLVVFALELAALAVAAEIRNDS